MTISKLKLEEGFVEELARLQPTAGFMRLVKDRVLHAWRDMKGDAAQRIAAIEQKQKAIRLDEGFLYERTIDIVTYDRRRATMTPKLCTQMSRKVSRTARTALLEAARRSTYAERHTRNNLTARGR